MKILIVKTSALGDIIQAFPALQFIRDSLPQAEIDWLVEKPFAELVKTHPHVRQVFTIDTKKWRSNFWKKAGRQEIAEVCQAIRSRSYNLVLDLQGNVKSGLCTALAKSPLKVGFGYRTVPEWPNLLFTNRRYNPPSGLNRREDYLFLAEQALEKKSATVKGIHLSLSLEEQAIIEQVLRQPELQKGLKVLVCPGSNWENKQLSQTTLQAFLSLIAQHMPVCYVFVWGKAQEKQVVQKLAASLPGQSYVLDRLSLPALQNLMARMQLIIAMDSLPLHLAGTTSTPTYSVFGPSSALKYKPLGLNHAVFQGTCPYGQTFENRCSLLRTCQTGGCMKNIEAHTLFDHFIKQLTVQKRAEQFLF